MDHQQIFDLVAIHLLRQNQRSMTFNPSASSAGLCAYRGNAGCKCSAGALIPDGLYDRDLMEGKTVLLRSVFEALVQVGATSADELGGHQPVSGTRLHLIRDLQTVHDTSEPYAWPVKLTLVAKQFDLQLPAEFEALVAANEASAP